MKAAILELHKVRSTMVPLEWRGESTLRLVLVLGLLPPSLASTPGIAFISVCNTKDIYNLSTIVSIPSLELGPTPLSRKRVCTPPPTKGGGGHARLRVREPQFYSVSESLSTLWSVRRT